MNKRIIGAVVAGGMLINTVGNMALVSAYNGATAYPENARTGITITMVDERQEQIAFYFEEPYTPMAIFKGIKLFTGEMHDNGLHAVNFTEAPWTTEYLATSLYDDDFEDLATGEERVYTTTNLASNTAKTMGMVYLFWSNAEEQSLYNIRARINYSRCADSAVYQDTEGAICRAEKDAEGNLYYQPYVDWERLSLPDETEEEHEILVYQNGEWNSKILNREEEDDTGTDEGSNITGDTESGREEDGGENTGGADSNNSSSEPEIRYVDRIVEVPVEVTKEVVREVPVEVIKEVTREVPVERRVEVEVPVEKIVTEKVEVQVPVEKTVVDTREVVREVPVLANLASEVVNTTTGLDGEMEETEEKSEEDAAEDENSTEEEDGPIIEGKLAEGVELPELGKEAEKDNELVPKLAIFAAGLVSVAAILLLATVFRKKKESGTE